MHETDYIVTNTTKLENKKLKFVKLLIVKGHNYHLPSIPALSSSKGQILVVPEHKEEMKNASEDLK